MQNNYEKLKTALLQHYELTENRFCQKKGKQFLNTCAAEIALFLKERVLESVEEMVRAAEQYMEVHCGTITGKTTKSFQKQKTEHKNDPEEMLLLSHIAK